MTSIVYTMVARGDSSEWIKEVYRRYKSHPFTYKELRKKIPEFKSSMITAMHNSNVIKLMNGNKRATGISKKNPALWVFTSEALVLLQKLYNDE